MVKFYTERNPNFLEPKPPCLLTFTRKVWILFRERFRSKSRRLDLLRHTRAMHLYRQGMPIHLLSEFLGHANFETTKVYAYADTEMKRKAIEKADVLRDGMPPQESLWVDDEDMILKLSGLR
jgi:integrase